jgi:CIC family chloride channel protein
MKRDPITVSPVAHFAEIGEKFIANRFNYLYVTDHGRFVGAVSLHDIKNYLNAPELAKVVIAEDLLHGTFPVVTANSTLSQALEIFTNHEGERLPVVGDKSNRQLVGSISKTDLILALADINRTVPAGA